MRISYWSSDVCSSDLLQSQRVEHGGQRFQRRIAILRQCIVECLQPEAGLAGDVAHPLGPCDVAERAGAMPGIVPFHRCFAIAENKIGRASCRERVGQYGTVMESEV